MLINWFTVLAQVINFLILVWLLKRFLYKPILNAVAEREKQIAAKLNEAEAKKEEAGKERDEFRKKNSDFDQQRTQQWNEAVDEIKTKKQLLLEEAFKESEVLREKLKKSLKDEQQKLSIAIIHKTQDEVFSVARKTLNDLANDSLEQQMVNVFIRRLKALNEEESKLLVAAFSASTEPVAVRSAFELISPQQEEIEKAVKDISGQNPLLVFMTNPEMISGIELSANGYKIAWSISDYLASAEKNISEAIYARLQINKEDTDKQEKDA